LKGAARAKKMGRVVPGGSMDKEKKEKSCSGGGGGGWGDISVHKSHSRLQENMIGSNTAQGERGQKGTKEKRPGALCQRVKANAGLARELPQIPARKGNGFIRKKKNSPDRQESIIDWGRSLPENSLHMGPQGEGGKSTSARINKEEKSRPERVNSKSDSLLRRQKLIRLANGSKKNRDKKGRRGGVTRFQQAI